MWRAPSPTDLRLVGDFGTSRAPSPTDLGFVGDFGTSGVLSPTDLRFVWFFGAWGVDFYREWRIAGRGGRRPLRSEVRGAVA